MWQDVISVIFSLVVNDTIPSTGREGGGGEGRENNQTCVVPFMIGPFSCMGSLL